MSVVAVAMVRDERDVIHPWLAHALDQCDLVLVADHGSVDGTWEALLSKPRVRAVRWEEPGYPQADVVNRLAHAAVTLGADWIVPMDADELWCSPHGRLRDVLPSLDASICRATVYEHVLSRPETGDAFQRLPWRREQPWPWPKVAFRPQRGFRLGMGAHEVSGVAGPVDTSLVVHHFPARSPEQLARKLARWESLRAAGHIPPGAIIQYDGEIDWEPQDGIVYDPVDGYLPSRGSFASAPSVSVGG